MNEQIRDIVFFIGSGFSWNAGLPTMAGFGDGAKEDYITLKKHAKADEKSNNFRNAAQLLVDAAEVFEGFRKLFENKILTKKELGNMEIIFCIAEALNESGIVDIEINDNPMRIDKILEEIHLWLWKIYQQYPPANPERKTEIKVLDSFFNIIKNNSIYNKITVISTNYDLVYESLSYKNGIPCFYPIHFYKSLEAGYGGKQYLYGLNEKNGKTPVCKLHGSVNFFVNSNNHDDNLFVASDWGSTKPIGRSGIWNKYPAIFAVDSIWNIRNKYGLGYIPAIIPPTYAKLKKYPWLRDIWNYAFEAIRNAKNIVFIGYSMPESDGFMRALFHGALAMRKNNKHPNIYLIDTDPEKKVYQRYQDFFKSYFKQCSPLSLGDAIKNGFIQKLINDFTTNL